MRILTHDESIDMIKNFFDVEHYDQANSILGSLLQAKIAEQSGETGRIIMPDLEEGLKEFFNNPMYKQTH